MESFDYYFSLFDKEPKVVNATCCGNTEEILIDGQYELWQYINDLNCQSLEISNLGGN
jgi:hypothetical protein